MKIFLSYAHDDERIAQRIRNYLTHHCGDMIFVMSDMTTGSNLQSSISDAIANSDAVLFIISKNTEKSEWVSQEISLAIYNKAKGKDIKLIPLRVDKNAEIPFFLKSYIYLDLSDDADFESEMSRLVIGLHKKMTTSAEEELSIQAERIRLESEYLKVRELQYNDYKKFKNRQIIFITMISTLLSAIIISISLVGWLAKIEFSQIQLILALLMSVLSSTLGAIFYLRKVKSNRHEIKKKIDELSDAVRKMEARHGK
ncbi:toll/interleukin-1 receptor domain-containing protein [Escherichia coli]|uniref:toll/interleukin-1 receptor domain-containing protein n=1 Tax=Escherichia coli TaxID=562 RepID=UPI000BE923E0|nr:toll/interleukin-1 receptor domain-containing protein [Escherichia coli]EFP9642284.1 toll/interleukin-1 receptor domain-containing protein [Shigella boydii]EFH6051719.1 TIR domain-containing protein [Escherichia coli]EFK2954677.1 toll/interleukin-1 receptor domain-containing protein [Escherichia coli]EFK2979274.1 toll/interleukin-1 receptor domain-containing protein [Escherichia coli]EFK3039436.1 toll/interleukin-1 receptor domain-containing protein [Escherichia coli]